jgi:transcriptional regulator with XRE-family HTH domain
MIGDVERRTVVRALRATRRRRGWTQAQLGNRLRISRSEVSRWERSDLDECSVQDVQRWATALGAHLAIELRVDGERPLADARHAEIQDWAVRLLRNAGWEVQAEASFNHYGDRGRIDVLAYHAGARAQLVIEIKTRIEDAQELLGRLDVKKRVAPVIARERGWQPRTVVPAVFVAESTTARRRIATHAALFEPLSLRARDAVAWLRQPAAAPPPGILAFVSPSKSRR